MNLVHRCDHEAKNSNPPEFFNGLIPSDIVYVTCVDCREVGREGYLFTSAGNIPHPQMIEDIHLVLANKKLMVLQCHTDCAKSKFELPCERGEPADLYKERLEAHTLERTWQSAKILLEDSAINRAVSNGMNFLVARHDVETDHIEFFKDESINLMHSHFRRAA